MWWYWANGLKANPINSCALQTKEGKIRSFPSMVEDRSDFGLALNNDKLFAIGGLKRDGFVSNTMETIDIIGDQWKVEEPLPFITSDHCIVSMDNKIVVMGGYNVNGSVSSST